ncbi:TPM domain-containing protein [Microbacterium sp. NPDC058342]|uniref:TPM domain-containing protein n=1 Tax=Microbacterium sp. NPDC058342 TaxID=3346454 RepID=UPI00365B2471
MALGVLVASGGAAVAETPSALDAGFVTDHADVLSESAEHRLEQRLGELAAAEDLPELYVILVPDFEDPTNALAWADDTAQRSNLGSDQYLLAIATEGRSLAISAEYGGEGVAAGPLPEARVLEIEDRLGSEFLRHGDWAGGIEYVADEFSEVPWPWWVWVLGLAALALIVFGVTRLVLALRRRAAAAVELRTLEGQKQRAARSLVRTDEAVRTSEQELGFVTAEFGEETTTEFRTVLDGCRERLQGGFTLLQKLQDATEDTLQETRSWTDEIIRLCGQIDRDLEGRRRQLASLRALAEGADKTLARLRAARAEAAELPQQTAERIATLTAEYTPAELVGVSDNAEEAGQRLRDADAQLEVLTAAVQGRKPRAISDAVHEIERLLAEAADLRDAVDAHADALARRSAGGAGVVGSDALARAVAAVRAAETSVKARPGRVSALALTRLHLAQRTIADATTSSSPEDVERLAATALDLAQQVHTLIGATTTTVVAATQTARSTDSGPIMFDSPSSGTSGSALTSGRRYASTADHEPSNAGKTVWGAVSGGAVGFFGGLSMGDEAPGAIVLFVIIGVALGALSGAFGSGGGGGGSSSGWGGSSRSSSRSSSWRSSSRSSRSSSSRSSGRSSGGSRSSGRSGGRRF